MKPRHNWKRIARDIIDVRARSAGAITLSVVAAENYMTIKRIPP